ncbi:MAG: branched-chain amino acid ABC transporter permease [Alphaproteobacteria bacterium]|nr:branched-chain amino acid ABC transporter permease [Alphaproteobacteria bacterium]
MDPHLVQVLQLVLNGISIGSIYALVALGLVLTYKASEVLNFAYGDILMMLAFVGWGLIAVADLPFWLAVVVTVLVAALLSYALDRHVVRIIVGQPQFAGVMLAIALAFMICGMVSMAFGPTSRTYPTPWSGQATRLGPVVIADLNLVVLAAALIVTMLLFAFLRSTSLGIAIQAASQNQLAAYLCGIRVKRINSLVWAMSGGSAASAGFPAPSSAAISSQRPCKSIS